MAYFSVLRLFAVPVPVSAKNLFHSVRAAFLGSVRRLMSLSFNVSLVSRATPDHSHVRSVQRRIPSST